MKQQKTRSNHWFIPICAIATFTCLLFLFPACKKKPTVEPIVPPVEEETGVSVDLTTVPYSKLSDYRFFEGDLKNQTPAEKVIPYEPASGLFTDYAHKKRFIWMPTGTSASYVNDGDVLNLPVGAALIKTFYYDNVQPAGSTRIIETRIMIRKSSGWIFANYVWNTQQTEAYLDLNGSTTNVSWIQNGQTKSTAYRIPNETECKTCHKINDLPIPIGIKPQNLNIDYPYQSGIQNQLEKLIAVGYLQNTLPGNIVSTVNYMDQTKTVDERFRSYVDINCAHCHAEGKHCSYRPMRLAFSETSDPINLGLCVEPDDDIDPAYVYIIKPNDKNRSMMHFRLGSTVPSIRMPLLGRTIVHEEGLQLLEEWITWKQTCN
ncbi:hypothetical protein [Fluviicola taffensis]|uniref:Uncharacterized protein n=1 Tax=Fluviicola taffensis (strain DSM 16823 / NCIMB 13979 / RW262) TaxID=755732 RepID=F2IDJ2_FLUTR|nr:hypothetical protein [Fluviicola taffensis]AEA43365.1 hypothetical protein Fluta_1371 [Fluviicola taffensis DSM 16823]